MTTKAHENIHFVPFKIVLACANVGMLLLNLQRQNDGKASRTSNGPDVRMHCLLRV